jgi:hypothetical protein
MRCRFAAKVGEDGMPSVDYVALAGLRNSECFLPYRSKLTSTLLQGASIDSTIAKWLREAGYRNVEVCNWGLGNLVSLGKGGLDRLKIHLSRLKTKLDAGYTVVCSMTGSELAGLTLGYSRDSRLEKTFAGHYVLLRGVKVYTDGASFDIVSWGEETHPIANPEKVLAWSEIAGSYRGYVCGECG